MVTTLNSRQLLFAENVLFGMSLTDSYRAAGYSGEGHVAHAGASKLMAKPAISAFIAAQQGQATLTAIADRREVIARLTHVLRSESGDLGDSGLPIHEVSRRTTFKADGTRVTRVRTRSMSKHAALKQLARLFDIKKPVNIDAESHARANQRDIDATRATVDEAIARIPEPDWPPLDSPAPSTPEELLANLQRIGRNLNPRQRLFCEYLSRDVPATAAYYYAGYGDAECSGVDVSPAASRLLKRPAIARYLSELRRHSATPDSTVGLADRDETLSFLTQAMRASRSDIETQGRYIDQVIQDEITTANGDSETRVWVKSISQPRIMLQLVQMLNASGFEEPDDEHTRLIRAELEAVLANPGPTLPSDEKWVDDEIDE